MKVSVKNKSMWFILVITTLFTTFGFGSLTDGAVVSDRSDNKFVLEIDGEKCGYFKSFEGGIISAQVINETNSPGFFTKKHIGPIKYEDITIEINAGMSKTVYDWIGSMMTATNTRKNGAIIFCDYDMNSTKRLEFTNASIAEATFPAADGASKEESYIKVRFSPEYYKYVTTPKTKINITPPANPRMFCFNFRFNIDGLNASTTMTNKIDAVTVKQTQVMNAVGDARDYSKEQYKLEVPNIVFTVADASAQPLLDWYESFVISGNNDESFEKNGYLEYLDINRKNVLCRLDFKNLGIIRAESDSKVKSTSAELYCERVELQFKPDADFTAPTRRISGNR